MSKGFAFMIDIMTALIIFSLLLYSLAAINELDKGAARRGIVLTQVSRDLGNSLESSGTLGELFELSAEGGRILLNSTINSSIPESFGYKVSAYVCGVDDIPEEMDCETRCDLLGYAHGGLCKNNNPGCNAESETHEYLGDGHCAVSRVCCCKGPPQDEPVMDCGLVYNVSSGAVGSEVGTSRRVFTDRSSKFGMLQIEVWRK